MASNEIFCTEKTSVYPGQYEPLEWKENELQKALKKTSHLIAAPPVTITELEDYFKIMMDAPGLGRGDFFIYTKGPVLTITAMGQQPAKKEQTGYKIKKIPCACIKRDIVLPGNADPDFVTANYQNGILSIWIYKNGNPVHNQQGRIIVY